MAFSPSGLLTLRRLRCQLQGGDQLRSSDNEMRLREKKDSKKRDNSSNKLIKSECFRHQIILIDKQKNQFHLHWNRFVFLADMLDLDRRGVYRKKETERVPVVPLAVSRSWKINGEKTMAT